MNCPKCKSENVTVQMVSEQVVRTHEHSLMYKMCFGWWIWIFKWLFKLPLALILPKRTKTSFTEHKKMAVCQNCGHSWQVR